MNLDPNLFFQKLVDEDNLSGAEFVDPDLDQEDTSINKRRRSRGDNYMLYKYHLPDYIHIQYSKNNSELMTKHK